MVVPTLTQKKSSYLSSLSTCKVGLKLPKYTKIGKIRQNWHICSSNCSVRFIHFAEVKLVTTIFDVALSNGEHGLFPKKLFLPVDFWDF
jgi:hypothetical protein